MYLCGGLGILTLTYAVYYLVKSVVVAVWKEDEEKWKQVSFERIGTPFPVNYCIMQFVVTTLCLANKRFPRFSNTLLQDCILNNNQDNYGALRVEEEGSFESNGNVSTETQQQLC